MTPTAKLAAPGSRPIREGLFRCEPPTLIGSVCKACKTRQFPAREFCPACDSNDVEGNVPLATSGKLYSFTIIHQAPPGRETPYSLAYVDLDDGVRVMSQIDAPSDVLTIGMPLALDIRPVGEPEGEGLIGYVFVPSTRKEPGK
jgi:uncharacterized OB-fold protein